MIHTNRCQYSPYLCSIKFITMEYRTIGNTGMKVSNLSFGASSLGGVFHSLKEETGIRAVHTAVDHGINFIDVSPYAMGLLTERGVPDWHPAPGALKRLTLKDVLTYADRLHTKGLNLLSAPGNDLVAATALASAGCQLVLFTTGRGTPFGTFVPTMKISTNSALFKWKPGWIDFNAGTIVEDEPIETVTKRLIEYILQVASGQPVNNEKKGYREIAIFKTGITL